MDEKPLGRRKALKIVGSGLGVAGIGTVGAAASPERDLEEIYEEARRIRQKTGSQERFVEYLQTHCVGVSTSKSHFKKRNRSAESQSGDVSTEKVENADMTENLTVGGDYTHTIADYKVEIKDGYGTGEYNNDAVTISWKHADYDMGENGTHTDNATNVHLRQSGFEGALWSFDDHNACAWGCDLWFSVGTRMERTTTDTPRKLQATYQTVWNDSTSVTGMSVDSDGTVSLSVSGGARTYVEQIDRQVREESFETH